MKNVIVHAPHGEGVDHELIATNALQWLDPDGGSAEGVESLHVWQTWRCNDPDCAGVVFVREGWLTEVIAAEVAK